MSETPFPNLRVRLFLALLSVLLLAGCNTRRRVRLLEFRRLGVEKGALLDARQRLTSGQLPPSGTQLECFLSSSSINDLLKQADGFTFELNSVKGVEFRVDGIAASFGNGVPEVTVQLTGRDRKRGFLVHLQTVTTLELMPVTAESSKLRLRVHVADVAPDVRWKFFHIRFGLFVRRLLRLKAQEMADLLVVELPLRQLLEYQRTVEDGRTLQLGDAIVTVHAVGDTFQVSRNIQVFSFIFLKDGIRVFLKFTP
jgi:hypothetical protein